VNKMKIEFSKEAEKNIMKMIKEYAEDNNISIEDARKEITNKIYEKFNMDTVVIGGKNE